MHSSVPPLETAGDEEQSTNSTKIIMMQSSSNISNNKNDLSYCILWSPLPPLTWLIPFIGHVGIANSHGVASDFQGPYTVGDDGRMAFGAPTRALKVDVGDLPGGHATWDDAIYQANEMYKQRMHNICCDNCHSHVANALNRMPVRAPLLCGGGKWNMIIICFDVFFRARFLSPWAVVWQFGPFMIIVLLWALIKNL